jgi:thioredoxin reductase (NADPH)
MLWNSVVVEAYGKEPAKRLLGGIKVKNLKTGEITDIEVRS